MPRFQCTPSRRNPVLGRPQRFSVSGLIPKCLAALLVESHWLVIRNLVRSDENLGNQVHEIKVTLPWVLPLMTWMGVPISKKPCDP
jgi:hypothetical protein